MKLNLAVYTATEGYSWQNGTKISNNDLINYKRIIGRFPDPTVDVIPFGGAFLCNNKAVFYRFHIAKQADSKGRDALYLVLGECEKTQAGQIDFKKLFALPEFSGTSNIFPVEVNYVGGSSMPTTIDFSASFNKNYSKKEDLSLIGTFLSNAPNNDLIIRINGSENFPLIAVNYKASSIIHNNNSKIANPMPQQTADKADSLKKENKFSSHYTPIERTSENNHGSPFLLVLIIAITCLITGIVIGYWLKSLLEAPESMKIETLEIPQIQTNDKLIREPQGNVNIIKPDAPKEDIIFAPAEPSERPSKKPNSRHNSINPPVNNQNPIDFNNKEKPCPDCGEAIIGCQECRRSGVYRGRICIYCNGRGEKIELRLCPKHKVKLKNNNDYASEKALETEEKEKTKTNMGGTLPDKIDKPTQNNDENKPNAAGTLNNQADDAIKQRTNSSEMIKN